VRSPARWSSCRGSESQAHVSRRPRRSQAQVGELTDALVVDGPTRARLAGPGQRRGQHSIGVLLEGLLPNNGAQRGDRVAGPSLVEGPAARSVAMSERRCMGFRKPGISE
jgi:hypothetical protein